MNWLLIAALAWLISIGLIVLWVRGATRKGAAKEDDPDWFWNH